MEKIGDFSILFGGKAGDGIEKASLLIGRLLGRLGYRIYVYRDYPSLIRGGHTFSIIRGSSKKVSACRDKIDFLLALNQETIILHRNRLREDCLLIYNIDQIKMDADCGIGIHVDKILKEENAPLVMRNSCLIGSLCRALGIDLQILEIVFKKEIRSQPDLNLKVARRGYEDARELYKLDKVKQPLLPLLSGNEAVALGLVKAGLEVYIAYPMTPSSTILHFLAEHSSDFGLKVIHPENEIAVILMALGFAYAGQKTAVGTSGGGFCLMSEGLSLSGMAELPIVVILGQRPGPSTGLPTYSAQTDLHFALNAGHGEFVRFVIAPGDAEEAYLCSALALNFAWRYQIPSIILTDKELGEGIFNFSDSFAEIKEEEPLLWDGKASYKRYLNTEKGISPLAFVPHRNAVIKVNSYEHDESGITTEDILVTKAMQDKRLRKKSYLLREIEELDMVKTYGDRNSQIGLLCWGSNKGVCIEVAQNLGLKVIQPLVLSPFPKESFRRALKGLQKIICIENNATGQLAGLVENYGFGVDEKILKYDGRPFFLEELEEAVKRTI